MLVLFAPILLEALALLVLVVVWPLVKSGPYFGGLAPGAHADWTAWFIFLALTAIPAGFTFSAWKVKLPLSPEPAQAGLAPYLQAASSLAIGSGVREPEVVVLDAPTANALAFRSAGKWFIGITGAALYASLTPQQSEALTAHELSHLVIGDGFTVPDRRGRTIVGLVFGLLILGPFVFSSFLFGFSWYISLGMFLWAFVCLLWALPTGRMLQKNDDILADTVAVKLTFNPNALKETIEKLEDLYTSATAPFPPGAPYPDYLFISRASVDSRLANLDAIVREDSSA